MNHLRTVRQVASAARTLPTCRARYARPQTRASVRFYGNSPNQSPIIQRVIFYRARHLTWRRFGTFVAFAVPAVLAFEYLSWGIDLMFEASKYHNEDDGDEYEYDEEDEDDEDEDDEDEDDEADIVLEISLLGFPFGSFLPIPWTRRQLPRDPYAPDAEVVQIWDHFVKDSEVMKRFNQQLSAELLATASRRYRTTNVRQVGGFMSEMTLPTVPPREYDQLGIVFFDGLPHFERRPAPPTTLLKYTIQSLAVASGAAFIFMVKVRTNQVLELFGWHPFVIPIVELVDLYNKTLHNLRSIQEQQARAAAKKNAALEDTGNKESQDGAVVPQAKSANAPRAGVPNFKTLRWTVKNAFGYAFNKDLNKRLIMSNDAPRDCFSVMGTVTLQYPVRGVLRTHLHDFSGTYHMRKNCFVDFRVERKYNSPQL